MMNSIHNIFCIGRNYRLHAEELGNEVPQTPVVFMKPTHAAVIMQGQTIDIPAQHGEVHYEAEWVFRIDSRWVAGKRAEECIGSFALGIDLTLRDVQTALKRKSLPWLRSKGFRNSALLTPFQPFIDLQSCMQQDFSLTINDQIVQLGNISQMIFDVQTIIDDIGATFGLDEGDIVFSGTPHGVGALKHGDHLSLAWGEQVLGTCTVVLTP
jgi:2-keto-4-pentenoate hydratase/2-oxohepta-3-ene-1,7-dioic acid hydratase in catechol pathway